MATSKYGNISPRTAAAVTKDLLEHAAPSMILSKFGSGSRTYLEEPEIVDPLFICGERHCPGWWTTGVYPLGQRECGLNAVHSEEDADYIDCPHYDPQILDHQVGCAFKEYYHNINWMIRSSIICVDSPPDVKRARVKADVSTFRRYGTFKPTKEDTN